MSDYATFLDGKRQLGGDHGFEPEFLPATLFDFQRDLVEWACRRGRAAVFADCGLGKTAMQLVWAENVARQTGRPVLVVVPLAVAPQTISEGAKFGVEVERLRDGGTPRSARIAVTNYERLDRFDPAGFAGIVLDESSILKNFEGVYRGRLVEFARRLPYRLCCTATAAPNDFDELGNHSEMLGELGHLDMLGRFFRNDQHNSVKPNAHGKGSIGKNAKWRLKGHAEVPFWRWVCSWARALRRPSDLGYPDERFVLPPLVERVHEIKARLPRPGWLFDVPAVGLREEREERRRTMAERCGKVAELVAGDEPALVWCDLNAEGTRLAREIDGAVEVSGADPDDRKEEVLTAFARGELRVLVTKPKIGGFGLNLQRCARMTFFASHSFERYYQGVRRCWRFGQTRPVTVDTIATEGERKVVENLASKSAQAQAMFASLVEHMRDAIRLDRLVLQDAEPRRTPPWLTRS